MPTKDPDFDDIIHFHGHACPGLALGYRIAKLALQELGKRAKDEELVAIVENNSCAIDAIQVMLGCTFGKGNLFFKDHGKQVYTIMKRPTGDALRISVKWQGTPENAAEKKAWQDYSSGIRTPETEKIVHNRKAKKMQAILQATDEELFKVEPQKNVLPETARIHPSHICEQCGEKVMETRAVNKNGRLLCIPCSWASDA